MADYGKLLETVLNIHYHHNPKIIADVRKMIQSYYEKNQTNSAYEEVLRTIHGLMTDLPSNILLYFLTTIPLPKHENGNTAFSELMRKSRVSVLDNMQSVLSDYINNTAPSLNSINMDFSNEYTEVPNKDENAKPNAVQQKPNSSKRKMSDEDFTPNLMESKRVPIRGSRRETGTVHSCLKLLEICADYVILNLSELYQFYNKKNKIVWALVNQNICSREEQVLCYKHIEDLNRKRKWLRMIEAGHVSVDVIEELYGNSEIFLRERNLLNIIDESVFNHSEILEETIKNLSNK